MEPTEQSLLMGVVLRGDGGTIGGSTAGEIICCDEELDCGASPNNSHHANRTHKSRVHGAASRRTALGFGLFVLGFMCAVGWTYGHFKPYYAAALRGGDEDLPEEPVPKDVVADSKFWAAMFSCDGKVAVQAVGWLKAPRFGA